MPHRETISGYLRALTLEGVSIADWGRGTKPVTNYIQHRGCTYIGIDKLSHVGADIVADLTNPIELERPTDWAFCMEVLEHVEYPELVLENIAINLKDGGSLVLSVPFRYPIHSTEDYWRFTDQGIRLLLERNGFDVLGTIPTEDEGGWVVQAKKRE